MRIAGSTANQSMVSQLNDLQSQQVTLQTQVSTGLKFQQPGDDPSAMSQTLDLQNQGARNAQYSNNITTLQTRATAGYTALKNIKTALDRVSEIASQTTGATSSTDMKSYATEVNQLILQMAQLANTANGSEYLFGGTVNNQPPYTVTTDADGTVTAVTYNGNTDTSQSNIADGATISLDVPGENNTGSGPRGLLSDNRYGADLFNHLIAFADDLNSGNASGIVSTDTPALLKDEDNVIYQISNNSVIQTRLDNASTSATDMQNTLEDSLSNVAGANQVQTLTALSNTQSTYQAALEASSVLLKLRQNLLTYLS